jgi:branched-chain amino acid transport system substrate-binding protein
MRRSKLFLTLLCMGGLLLSGTVSSAQIKVGVNISTTGPAASLGIPQRDTVALLPKEIGGKTVEYMVLDDASDSTSAVKNVRKLTAEDQVDIILGPSLTPNSLAILDVLAESETPAIAFALAARIIAPMDAKRAWMFKTPQTDAQMASAILELAAKQHVKTLAYIGQTDAMGEAFYDEIAKYAERQNIKVVANERFNRTDSSVTGQALRIISAKPDAVVVGAAGTPAALPPKALLHYGYKGKIYHNPGVANNDFLRVCGKDCEGTFLPASPVTVAAQLPDDHPVKQAALEYVNRFEARYGKGSVTMFGSYLWDAALLLNRAVPQALREAQPGTKEFRHALRTALEHIKELNVSNGVVNMSATDHQGLDERSRVIVQIMDGGWKLVEANAK